MKDFLSCTKLFNYKSLTSQSASNTLSANSAPNSLSLTKVQPRKSHGVARVAGRIPLDFPKHPPKPVF